MPVQITKPSDYPLAVTKQIGLLAQNIVIARKRRKETQAQWAKKLGVSQPTMARIERGDPAVAMASYVMCMWLINPDCSLADLIAPQHDHVPLERDIAKIRARRTAVVPSVSNHRGSSAAAGLTQLIKASSAAELARLTGVPSAADMARLAGTGAAAEMARLAGVSSAADMARLAGTGAAAEMARLAGVSSAADMARLAGTSAAAEMARLAGVSSAADMARLAGTSAAAEMARLAGVSSAADMTRKAGGATSAADVAVGLAALVAKAQGKAK
ncbi:hypothetical protein LHU53_07210 [Rhodoferax sp. U2-2l]|uniref:hypothetical protein n=1 Tax=Rhodoferax sp. U2-2l TaxID=2884000 RepID=UPI001D09B794|nr:hypothetical protein [Rhodoferax sp. U2-2l]MCB8746694.1 hypothetical protein [Rhodoferax sp. U2-2l]